MVKSNTYSPALSLTITCSSVVLIIYRFSKRRTPFFRSKWNPGWWCGVPSSAPLLLLRLRSLFNLPIFDRPRWHFWFNEQFGFKLDVYFLIIVGRSELSQQLCPTRWVAFLGGKKRKWKWASSQTAAFDDFGVNSRWLCNVAAAGVTLQSGGFLAGNQSDAGKKVFFFFRLVINVWGFF